MPTWANPPLPARLTEAGHPCFVGRRRELDHLEDAWAAVERGERQAVFIGGEPGSGKTRLAIEVALALHAQDVVVLLGSTSPDLGHPYQPMVEPLEHLLTRSETGSLRHLTAEATELLRITPHVRIHSPDMPDQVEGDQDQRLDLFDAYSDFIRSVALDRPLALILEDLQWSSAPSRLLLSHLIRATAGVPLLILGTMRTTAPDRSDELSFAIAELHRTPGVSRLDLQGLEQNDVETYLRLQGASAQERLEETAAILRDQTGGNPFFVREMWRQMNHDGGLPALRSGNFVPPPTVRDALRKRIQSFAEVERTVLEMAAVAGENFDIGDVASASSQPLDEVFEALDRSIEFGLITDAGGGRMFAFRHALIRQTILADLAASRSARLHARLAVAIEPRFETEPHLATLLFRLFDGARALGYDNQTIRYLRVAAQQAERSLAHEDAADLWESATRMLGSDIEQREELLLKAARCQLRSGDFADARRLYRGAHGSSDVTTSLKAAIGFEDASWRPGHHGQEALDLLVSSLERFTPDPTDHDYIRAITALGRAHTFTGRLEDADRIGTTALDMARDTGDEALIGEALIACLLQVMTSPGIDPASFQRASELREIAHRSREFDRLGPAGAYAARASYMAGDIGGWYAGWSDIQTATAKTAQPFWEWVVGCYEHCHHFLQADFVEAEATAERIRELGFGFGTDDTDGPYGLQMYMVRRETAELDSVRPLISGDPSADGTWKPGLLALYTELGLDDPARTLMWAILDTLGATQSREAIWPATLVFLAEAAVHLRDADAVATVWPLMQEYEGCNLVAGQSIAVFGSSDRYLAQMSEIVGDHDAAERHFEKALTADRETRSIVHQGETLAKYASMLLRRGAFGDAERAARLQGEARDLAMPTGHERVLALLTPPDTALLPDGLTPREAEVLALIAEGATNKEIGERLFISQNTAANHVRSILMKTASANRTQAAIYATDRGLVP